MLRIGLKTIADDEMRKQSEEVSKEENKNLHRKTEGDALHFEGIQKGPELVVPQHMAKENSEKKGKVTGWSTEKMEEKVSNQLVKRHTVEMVSWRSTSQEEINEIWKSWLQNVRKKCWNNTKWRTAKEKPMETEASLLNGGWSGESKNLSLTHGVRTVGQDISLGSGSYSLQRKQGMQEGQTEKEEMRQVLMEIHDLCMKSPSQPRGEEGVQILKEEEKDAKPLVRCEENRDEWAKHWQ